MEEQTLNWSRLPMEFKMDVANRLDLKSRKALQLSSKSNNMIVSYCPVNFKNLCITPIYQDYASRTIRFHFVIHTLNSKGVAISYDRCIPRDEAIDEFIKSFKNRKSFVDRLELVNGKNMESFLYHLLLRIRTEKEKNDCKVKIRVRHIEWRGNFKTEYVYFMELLSYFDVTVLKTIVLESYSMSRDAVERLIATEQFKNANKVCIHPLISIPIEHVFHLNTIELQMSVIKPDDVVKLIKNFRVKNIPNDSHFTLTSEEDLPCSFNTKVNDLLGLPENTRESISLHETFHVLKFSIRNEDSVLLVKFDKQSVFGAVVTKEFLSKLAVDVAIYMDLREFGFDWDTHLKLISSPK